MRLLSIDALSDRALPLKSFSVEKKGRHGQELQKGRRTVRQIHNQNHTCKTDENGKGRYSVLTHDIWGKNIGRTVGRRGLCRLDIAVVLSILCCSYVVFVLLVLLVEVVWSSSSQSIVED